MGLFLQNHENYETFVKNRSNSTGSTTYTGNNNGDMASYFVNSGVSIFGTLLQKVSDGKGGNDDDTSGTSSKATKIKEELNTILSEIGAKDKDDIQGAYERAKAESDKKINESTYKAQLATFENGTDKFTQQINDKKTKYREYDDDNDKGHYERSKIEDEIKKLNKERTAELNKIKAEQEKLEKEEQVKMQELEYKVDQAKALSERLLSIEDPSAYNNTESKAIKEKTNDFIDFNKARKAFEENPTEKNFKKLDKAFSNFENPSQSVITTIKMLKQKYPDFWK